MKALIAACAAALAGVVSGVAGPAAAQACLSTCNTAHDQCTEAGKNDTVCLNAWHQCRTGCATPSKLQVTRPSPNTVVIKTVAAKKK